MTTPAVIQLTHYVDASLIARLFARFRGRYGNLWTSRASHDDDWEFIMDDWLEELSKFSFDTVRAAVNKTLTEFKEYPPTLGQLVKILYDKIGSWTLTNGKTEEIERKVKEHYAAARSDFHTEPQKAWSLLEDYNAKPKELLPPPKIPKDEEMKAFRECMSKCQEILQNKKIIGGGKTYKEFDANKIKKGHKDFDRSVYEEYKAYLLSIPETETMILPPVYLMERNKFLNMREQPEWLKKHGYIPRKEREGFGTPKASDRSGNGKPTKVYKNWAND